MQTELKDVIHLYIGCEVQYIEKLTLGNDEKRLAKSFGINDKFIDLIPISFKGVLSPSTTFRRKISDIKPILRRLEDMTEEEKEILKWDWKVDYDFNPIFRPEQYVFILSNGFDLFNLITTGQAIDRKTLNS